jgi:hypothetical protein
MPRLMTNSQSRTSIGLDVISISTVSQGQLTSEVSISSVRILQLRPVR